MKLIRNISHDGRCKYALIRMQELTPAEQDCIIEEAGHESWETTVASAAILIGNESPSDQFFVLKYKDKFTASALRAYANAVREEAQDIRAHSEGYWDNPECAEAIAERQRADSLDEYAQQVEAEAEKAREQGCKIPD